MRPECEVDSKLRQLHYFDLDDWGAIYNGLPEDEFLDYRVANPGIFKLDQLGGWPRVKRAPVLKAFRFGVTENNQKPARIIAAELWVFPFDIVAVSLELQYTGSLLGLRGLSLELKASIELRGYAEQLARSRFADNGCHLLGRDDNQYIQIHQPIDESTLEERFQDITSILTGDDQQFSEQYMEEILENTVPYTPYAYAFIGSRCVIQVDAKIDDLLCLWMFQSAYAKKSQRVEGFLDARLQQTYGLLARRRSSLPMPSFSYRALQQAKPFDRLTLQIVERFLTPVEVATTGFFSLANKTIADVLDSAAWQITIKEKYSDLEDSYEHLENAYSMKNQEFIEWLIIIVIILSAALTILTELGSKLSFL